MRTRLRGFLVCLIVAGSTTLGAASDSLQQVLGRMDKAASDFRAMTAQVTRVTHVDVLNEDSTDVGTVIMKKVQPDEVQGRVDFTSPDARTITIAKRRVQEYLPKMNTLEIFDLDKHGAQLDKFFMIGFGTSGTELAANYDVKISGSEQLKEQTVTVTRLQLIPKSSEVKHYIVKLELWIPEQGDPYPLREKIFEPSGDQITVTYNNLKINPALQPDALQLKLPPGVKTEHPGQ
jgi:outer membrane lipoprotein-sorting protein